MADINPNSHYDEELEHLNQSINEIEELYTETKEHFDAVKASRSKGSLSFIHLQTSNLISLKNAKFQMLKEKISVRKNIADLTIKQKTAEGDAGKDSALVREIFEQLIKHDNSNSDKNVQYVDDNDSYDDEDVDSALQSKINELKGQGKLEFSDNEKKVKFEKSGEKVQINFGDEFEEEYEEVEEEVPIGEIRIMVQIKNKKWSFIGVTETGEIVEDCELPDKKKFKMRLTSEDGKVIAVDQDDKVYDVIRK